MMMLMVVVGVVVGLMVRGRRRRRIGRRRRRRLRSRLRVGRGYYGVAIGLSLLLLFKHSLLLFEFFLRLEILSQIIFRFRCEGGFLGGFVHGVGFQRRHDVRLVRMQVLLQFVLAIEALAARLALEPLLRHVDGFNVPLQLVLSGKCLGTFYAFEVANVRVSRDFVPLQPFATAKRLFTEFAVDPRFQSAAQAGDYAAAASAAGAAWAALDSHPVDLLQFANEAFVEGGVRG